MRESLRQTATELFAHNGFHATGVKELSEAIGVGRGALYHYMSSKEEILFEICTRPLEGLLARASEIAAQPISAEQRLRLLARDLMEDLADERLAWMVGLRELASLTNTHRTLILEARDQYEQFWLSVLADGVSEGQFTQASPLICKGILGLLNNSHLWLSSTGRLGTSTIADAYSDLILNGLRSRAPANTSVRR
jgi:AcrR family transcriptional regulator